MELIAILSVVDGRGGCHTGAPECALEVGDACGVFTSRRRLHTRISLDVYIKGCAEVCGVAKLLAADRVIGSKRGETQIGIRIDGCLKVLEGLLIACRGRRRYGNVLRTVSANVWPVCNRRS